MKRLLTILRFPMGCALAAAGLASAHAQSLSYTPYAVTTLAGTAGDNGWVDTAGASARFSYPYGIAVDGSGTIYVADALNYVIRKVDPSGTVTTLAGQAGTSGNTDGLGTAAQFGKIEGIAIDGSGNLFVTDWTSGTVREVSTVNGNVTTLVPAGTLSHPVGIAVDNTNHVYYVADTGNAVIRKISQAGAIATTFSGFGTPSGVAVDSSGNVYVTDTTSDTIRKISSSGTVSTYAGQPGSPAPIDGSLSTARFFHPFGIAIDGSGNIFLTDQTNNQGLIREISAGGTVTTLAGALNQSGSRDGTGSNAWFLNPYGVAVTSSGNLIIADTFNYTIRKAAAPTVTVTPPSIQTQPQSQTVNIGGSVTFSVVATGTTPLSYQWTFGGGAISGATASSYTLTNAQVANAGNYAVTVTNSAGNATSSPAVLTVNAAPSITVQPQNVSVSAGASATFSVTAIGAGLTYQWAFNGIALAGATSSTYTINGVTTSNAGAYTVVVSNSSGNVTSNGATLTINGPGAPSFTIQPTSETVVSGSTVVFNAAATGTPTPTYQWMLNNAAISGATSARLVLTTVNSADLGTYTVIATNSAGNATSSGATLTFTTTSNPGRLINLSVLSNVQGTLTAGFVIGGSGTSGSENLLIRATGPALAPAPFNVPNVLSDPTLSVNQQSTSTIVATNSGWGTPSSNVAIINTADSATGAFALTDSSSKDSALVTSLAPSVGGYTVQVKGASGDSGNALTEVYDDTAGYTVTTPRLVNLSCLTQVSAGGTLTAGFVIGGTTARTVLVRATGPALALAPFNVGGTMPDPQIKVQALGGSSVLASNAGWGGDSQITATDAAVGAFALTNSASKDSVVLLTLAPGPYTAQVTSVSGAGGFALVEVYEVP